MSGNNTEEESISPSNLDETNSARKRRRMDSFGLKNWTLTERLTDHDVLHEMGVSILEPDETEMLAEENLLKSSVKRKRDIENVNPNVNSSCHISPRKKLSPRRSPKKICSPTPGPSKIRSPRSTEKNVRPLQPPESLETTVLQAQSPDEETPLPQHPVNSNYVYIQHSSIFPLKERSQFSSQSLSNPTDGSQISLATASPVDDVVARGVDAFSILSDEVMLSIFKWLPKMTLARSMLVCKRWHQVASDETFWQRLELGNRVLSRDAIGKILARKPVIVRLAGSEIGQWTPPTVLEQSRIQYLDLSMATVDVNTLNALIQRCQALKKLSLELLTVNETTCQLIGHCSRLDTLNLTMSTGITANGLNSLLEGCTNLQSLNISWCRLCAYSLNALVGGVPQILQRINLAGARIMTDDMVRTLVHRCPRLLELDLSDCSRLAAPSVHSIMELQDLNHLALSRCYQMPTHVLTKLGGMVELRYLEVWGMLQEASLRALKAALPSIQINKFMNSAIARPTVGLRRTSIWGKRTRD